MQRLLIGTNGPGDWRRLLAEPERQWKRGRSAFEMAVSWEAVRHTDSGLPTAIEDVFRSSDAFRGARLLVGVPEHQVALEGGGHASQTDLWALVAASVGMVSVAVEAKAGETFDRPVPEWLGSADDDEAARRLGGRPRRPSGKPDRLRQICRTLEISEQQAHACWYQLLHRTTVAILEAQRLRIGHAMLLIQSFKSGKPDHFADYQDFARQLQVDAPRDAVVRIGIRSGIELYLGWVGCPVADDALCAQSVS